MIYNLSLIASAEKVFLSKERASSYSNLLIAND